MIDRVLYWVQAVIERWIYQREERQELRDRDAGYPNDGPLTRAYRAKWEADLVQRANDSFRSGSRGEEESSRRPFTGSGNCRPSAYDPGSRQDDSQ